MSSRRPSSQTLDVLQAMLQRPAEEHYGLQLATEADVATGTIYPILMRLERDGWVTSHPEDVDPALVGRPPRRLYQLSRAGAAKAQSALATQNARLAPSRAIAARPMGGTA